MVQPVVDWGCHYECKSSHHDRPTRTDSLETFQSNEQFLSDWSVARRWSSNIGNANNGPLAFPLPHVEHVGACVAEFPVNVDHVRRPSHRELSVDIDLGVENLLIHLLVGTPRDAINHACQIHMERLELSFSLSESMSLLRKGEQGTSWSLYR